MIKKSLYFLGIFLILLSVSMVSAGLGSWLGITGKATSQPTNVSVTMKDTTPAQIQSVSTIAAVTPSEASTVTVTFSTQVYDFDKLRDINFSSVYANFTNGATTRGAVQCTNVNNVSNRVANFSCSVAMWYWDVSGAWNVNVVASDIGNKTPAYNTTTSFTYNQLKAMVISPNALTWPSLSIGAPNQTSNNDPTIINNTGNYNGTVLVTGYDLVGESDTTENISIGNFSSSIQTGVSNPECGLTTSNILNTTGATISSAAPNPGNLSLGSGAGQANLYYCLRNVPNVSAQTYSTLNSASWVVGYGA